VALNRVTGSEQRASQIAGNLTANGKVILINPNGILFDKTAKVDVAGLVASTANLRDADFMAGSGAFNEASSNKTARVVNKGTITLKESGLGVLVAPDVANEGTITAKLGRVALGGAETATIDFYGNGMVQFAVQDTVLATAVANNGAIINEGGSITLTAKAASDLLDSVVTNTGSLTAKNGGSVEINATRTNLDSNSSINVDGAKDGGTVAITTKTGSVNGTVSAQGVAGKGGTVIATGEKVLVSGSIKAEGKTGGGKVFVGGDYLGGTTAKKYADKPIKTAKKVVVTKDASISVNATDKGNGGTAIVWSDDYTYFAGNITAHGGLGGGNGGFIETSSKENLQVTGLALANARAKGYTTGTWLLDPRNVTITGATAGGTFDSGTPNIFTPTSDSATVLNTTINTALNNGTTVIITTNDGDGSVVQAGDITIAADITKSSGASDAGLILRATNSIFTSGTRRIEVTGGTGKLNVKLNSDSDNSGAGAILLTTTTTINTNGGNISMGGGNAASNSQTGAQYNDASVALTDYAVGTAANNQGVYIQVSSINAGAGNISVRGIGAGNTAGNYQVGIFIQAAASLSTTTGNITLTGIAGTGAFYNNGIQIQNLNTTISTQSGAISLTGTGGSSPSTGGNNVGLLIYDQAAIRATTTGSVTLSGTGGGGVGGTHHGVQISSIATGTTPVSVVDGNLSITGTGGTSSSGVNNQGVLITAAGIVRSTGLGTVTVNGTGGNSSAVSANGNNYGVFVANTQSEIAGLGTGSVTVTGLGGTSTTALNDAYVYSGLNYGVYVQNGGTLRTTGSAALTVNGTGGVNGHYNRGIQLLKNGAIISTISVVNGAMILNGQGGTSNIIAWDFQGITNNGLITATGSGAITLNGTGGAPTGGSCCGWGIEFNGGTLTGGSGLVTLNAVGGTTSIANEGLMFRGANSLHH
jgi:hypothetical protein